MLLDHIMLSASDPAALLPFYRDTLGLSVLAAGRETLVLQAGATRLEFRKRQSVPAGICHFAFNIPENQLTEGMAWLRERVPLVSDDGGREVFEFAAWNARAVYFHDPDGSILELIARHDLPNASRAPFGSGSLLNISEIGLVTDDVPGQVRALQTAAGLEVYRPGTDNFAPVGDANGLFIVVRTGRPWFAGSGRSAVSVPLEAAFRNAQGKPYLLKGGEQGVTIAGG